MRKLTRGRDQGLWMLLDSDKDLPAYSEIKALRANIEAGMSPYEALRRFEDIKIKGDPLRGFTGCLPMHLNQER